MGTYSSTERVGVTEVARIVVSDLGWIFREQPIVDMGIDAQIELVANDNTATGQLIGVQIKTGAGNFHETPDAYVYYGDTDHLDYWTGHSLPVILVAHFPETGDTLWAVVSESAVERTKKGWKLAIPKTSNFGGDAREILAAVFAGTPAQQFLRKLAIDESLMRHIAAGGKVSLELEKWVNKSLGRTPVQVFVHDKDGNETLSQEWFQYYVGYGIKELAEALFPWATARVDEEFYEENSEFNLSTHDRLMLATDIDNGYPPDPIDPDVVYPYAEAGGEVESYRLQLYLNDLGEACLTIADYLARQGNQPSQSEGRTT
jgi:hypothetical protein